MIGAPLLAIFVSCKITPEPMFSDVTRFDGEFPTNSLEIGVARIQPPDAQPYDLITPIPHEVMFKQGLAREAVIGRLKRLTSIERDGTDADKPAFRPEDFIPNPAFTAFLHRTVARHAPELKDYQNQAKKRRDGWIYVIDGRASRSIDPIPPRDILGAFSVHGGIISPNSYHRQTRTSQMISTSCILGMVFLGSTRSSRAS